MQVVAALALGYLPGWATARWLVARTGTGLAPERLSPFVEVLLSVCLSSWVGFLLAEAGAFSLGRLSLFLLVYSGIVGLAAGRRPRPARARFAPTVGVLVLAGIVGLLYLPPFDTSIMGSDATFYLGAGVHLGRHGTLVIADPLLAELGPVERRLLFPPNVAGGWARVPGGLLLPSLDATVVHPSFSHLLPVWIALFHTLGGLRACSLVPPVFAGLGLWAFWLVANETHGRWMATLATGLLATNLGQWFYGRFLMPEIVAQALLWGGLLAFSVWWRDGRPSAGVLAALALGVAGLTRVENLFLLPLALVLFFGLSARRPPGTGWFVVVYGALVAHGILHLLLVPTHYRDVMAVQARFVWRQMAYVGAPTRAVMLGLVGVFVLLILALPGRGRSLVARRAMVVALAGACAAMFVARSQVALATSLAWLAGTTSWLVVAAAGVGLALWPWRGATAGFPFIVFLVAGAPLLWDAHVTPVQLWAVRRFVPLVIPFVCLLAAAAIARVAEARRGAVLALVLAGALLAANARPMGRLRGLPLFPDHSHDLEQLAAQIPTDAVVFFAPELTDYLIHLPLWLIHDRESIVLPVHAGREALERTVPLLTGRRSVLYVGHGFGPLPAAEGLQFRARGDVQLRNETPQLDPLAAPAGAVRHLIPLRVYAVTARGAG